MKYFRRIFRRIVNVIWGGYRRGGICGLYHWIRCHVWKRYHIINISGEGDYDWGWIDRNYALLLASFKILRDFVEKEDPQIGLRKIEDYVTDTNNCMYEVIKKQIEIEKEIRLLYDWWTKERHKENEECSKLTDEFSFDFSGKGFKVSDEKKFEEWSLRDEMLEQKDNEMLIRLIKVRQSLWT